MSMKQSITGEANMLGTFRTEGCNVESNDDHDFFQFLVTENFAASYNN